MSALSFIDCQGLAGAWTLGAARAGFEIVHRASLGRFGDEVIEHNRHLVPGPWEQDDGNGSAEWTPVQGALLAGTPPCSGFSLLNKSKGVNARGVDSGINNCMVELVRYAGRCTGVDGEAGPELVSFESVQGAFSKGRPLMQRLRDLMEDLTSQRYGLSHVLMSGSSVGAAQMRHRYFMVLHRVPFGIDPPEPRRVATYRDAIGDLEGLRTDTWDEQVVTYDYDRTRWLREQRLLGPIHITRTLEPPRTSPSLSGSYLVRDHVEPSNGRIELILRELLPYWPTGTSMNDAIRAHRADLGLLPSGMESWWDEDADQLRGFTHETRVRADRPGYVLTGGGVTAFIHYSEPRFLTVRECARLMGFPDSWSWAPARNIQQASNWIGKICPVQSGQWLAGWAKRALERAPGAALELIGEREFLHQSTLLYKKWPVGV